MTRGVIHLDAPHICGQLIHVEINWIYDPGVHTFRNGDPGYPGTYEAENTYYTDETQEESIYKCPKCGIDLQDDTIFEKTIETLSQKYQLDDPEYYFDDEPEYDPPDTYEQRQWERDPDDLLPPGRAG
jgi:hypothetical protein